MLDLILSGTQNRAMQIYEPGKGLDFHFDKDERLMKEQKQMSHPILSCILYLTGSPEGSCMGKIPFHGAGCISCSLAVCQQDYD